MVPLQQEHGLLVTSNTVFRPGVVAAPAGQVARAEQGGAAHSGEAGARAPVLAHTST